VSSAIEAFGLIYTNVEAKESPTGQRGFQVWQASAGLSAEARKEISRRVDDYRLPAGTTPEAAATLTRDGYFALSAKAGGGFAVARSVPLNGKDKFGRGGRFLAHVLVVKAADFARLGHDPFALFDAAPFLCSEPGRLILDHPEWVKGVLPVTHLTPVSTPGELLPGPLRAAVAGHIDRDPAQRKTVVVVGSPAEVAAELRRIYRGLPPALRAVAEFDTLSAGASLTQVPCAFAGCPTESALKMWPFRRFVRFHPAEGKFTPPSELQPPTSALRGGLPGTTAWADATDAARHTAWAAATAIEANDVAAAAKELDGDAATALAILEGVPQFNATLERWRREWFARCPAVVTAVPGVQQCLADHLAVPLGEELVRLRGDVPRPRLADILLHEIAMKAYRGPTDATAEVLGLIQDWLGKDHGAGSAGRRLDWVLSRLRGRDANGLGLALTASDDDDATWLRTWVREYAEVTEVTAAKLCAGLPHHLEDDEIDRQHLYDAELYLQCAPNEPPDVMKDLRFRHACRTGGLAGLVACGDLPEPAERLAYFRRRAVLGWTMLSDATYFVGAFVYPECEAEAELLRLVYEDGFTGRQALPVLAPHAARKPGDALPKFESVPGYLQAFLDKLTPPKGKRLDPAKLEGLRKEFDSGNEQLRREATWYVLGSLRKESRTESGSGWPAREASLFGLVLKWIDPSNTIKSGLPELLQIVLGAAGPELDRYALPSAELRDRDPAEFARLLSWM